MMFKRLSSEQFCFIKATFSMPIGLWGNYFNLYYCGMYKKIGLLDPRMIIFHIKRTTLVLKGTLRRKGFFASGFFDFYSFQMERRKKIKMMSKAKSYIVLLSKLFGFFSNLKAILRHKHGLRREAIAKYSFYRAYRLPSVVYLMKNKGYINTKETFFHSQFLRLRTCLFQSLASNQVFNGLGYCIYINDCLTLYSFYNQVCVSRSYQRIWRKRY